jgi:DNA-binding winged helix-turn-helix (wHTH) protein/Tol biopolymer transport system component
MPESRDGSALGRPQAGQTDLVRVKFGPFTLDLADRKLRKGEEQVPLPSRAFDALAYLVTHRNRALDRDEIIANVWHDVAVTDDSLIHAVSVLRRALGDDPAHASFIETIPRRGYRFVGHVEIVEPAEPPNEPSVEPTDSPEYPVPMRGTVWPWRTAMAPAIVVVVITAAIVYGHRAFSGATSPTAVRLEQVAPPGTTIVSGGIVSPTGRQLAFVARDEVTERTALWVRALDANDARMLPGSDGAAHAFFSPDGRQIAFFRTGELVATDVGGGQLRRIATVHGAPAGGSWGAGGVIVFAEWMTGLYAVASAGGPASAVTRLDHTALDVAHAWPQFLPDGKHFLYQVVSPDSTRAGVYISGVDGRTSTRLLDEAAAATYVPPGFLLYVRRGMLLAEPFDAAQLRLGGRAVLLSRDLTAPSLVEGNVISASRDMLAFRTGSGKQQLTWVDRAGVSQGSLAVPTAMFNFRVSPDGQYLLAASSLTDSTGVWRVDLARRHSTQLADDGIAPLWSPDGRRVAFTSRAGLDLHVEAEGSDVRVEPLVSDQSVKVLNDWSARSQTIIYTRHDAATKLDLWHLPLAGGGPRPLLNSTFNEVQARVSPDGRWLAYVTDSTGTQEVYVRRYPELDAPRQVSAGGGGQPQWRPDQRELFYLSPDRSLMAVTVTDAGNISSFGAPRKLFRTSIAEGPSAARDSYAVMPDGRSFLIDARRVPVTEPITVMLNWASGLTSMPTKQPADPDTAEIARRTSAD